MNFIDCSVAKTTIVIKKRLKCYVGIKKIRVYKQYYKHPGDRFTKGRKRRRKCTKSYDRFTKGRKSQT